MTVSGPQVAAHYQHQVAVLAPLIDGYRHVLGELAEADKAVTDQRVKARRELAEVYLTELTDAAFARVAQLTGFKGFERRDPRAAREQERKVLQQAIARLDADDRFARRDQLVGPGGSLTQELDNAKDTLQPLEQECQKFESQLGFSELVDIGYDTPAFSEKWWHATYWKHWAAGDRICKALGMNDFGDDVLPAYKKVAEPRNFMRDEVKRISAEIDEIHGMAQKRDQALDRIAHLDEIYLSEAQDYLAEHLDLADAALLEQWAAADPNILRAVQMGVRKLAGLAAKKRFLGEMQDGIARQVLTPLEERRSKANTKWSKFSRAKYAYANFNDNLINREFDQKAQAFEQQREKLRRRTQALVAAQNYAGFDLRNDQELWWLYLMQSPPPRLAPSLFDYYQRRPNVQPITDPDFVDMGPTPGEAAATAYAAGELEQGTYLS